MQGRIGKNHTSLWREARRSRSMMRRMLATTTVVLYLHSQLNAYIRNEHLHIESRRS